jgi:hypothetical protein
MTMTHFQLTCRFVDYLLASKQFALPKRLNDCIKLYE